MVLENPSRGFVFFFSLPLSLSLPCSSLLRNSDYLYCSRSVMESVTGTHFHFWKAFQSRSTQPSRLHEHDIRGSGSAGQIIDYFVSLPGSMKATLQLALVIKPV